jgi:hypothetical protein
MSDIEIPDPEELEKLKAKQFTKRVAFLTAMFAVILAITSLGGNNAMKGVFLAQQQASDQWAYYQSKAIREHMYKMQRNQLEANLFERKKTMSREAYIHYSDMIKKLKEEEERYAKEKKAIEIEARKLEHERDIYNKKDPYFDYAEVLLQIAIVLASISILASSTMVFAFALVAASLGSLLSINGYLLVFRIPFFH